MKKTLFTLAQNIFRFFFVCRLDGEVKKYYLKHTPLHFDRSMRAVYEKKYGSLEVVPNRIVVDNYMGNGYGCNGKYVTEELLKTPGKYEIIWVVDDVEAKKEQFPEGVKLVKYLSQEACIAYATAKIWLCNYHMVPYVEKFVFKKPEQIFIQMWHGSLGIKKIEGDSKVIQTKENWLGMAELSSRMTDYWIANSTFEEAVYKSAFWGAEKILFYGHARNDLFFRDMKPVAEKVKQTLGIKTEEKMVLYVPTHRDEQTAEGMENLDFMMLREALGERFGGSWRMVVRLHRRTAPGTFGENAPDIIRATEYPDVQELLAAADVVVTDYSSCIFDFMLTGRPAFFYVADREAYSNMRGLYYPLTSTPFPVAADNKEMRQKILSFSMEQYTEEVRAFLDGKGCMEDGCASKRIKELIDREINC
jgi:CDP-glycerol glycerophosphotransferase